VGNPGHAVLAAPAQDPEPVALVTVIEGRVVGAVEHGHDRILRVALGDEEGPAARPRGRVLGAVLRDVGLEDHGVHEQAVVVVAGQVTLLEAREFRLLQTGRVRSYALVTLGGAVGILLIVVWYLGYLPWKSGA